MQLLIPSQKLSTNDVLSAVLWHVACDIRGRPRPFQPSCAGHGCLAYPLNLRSMHVPQQYCGNALLVNLLGGTTPCLLSWVSQTLLQFADFWAPVFVRYVYMCLDPDNSQTDSTPESAARDVATIGTTTQQATTLCSLGGLQLECLLVHLWYRHDLLATCMPPGCRLRRLPL